MTPENVVSMHFGSHLIERVFGGQLGSAQLVFSPQAFLAFSKLALMTVRSGRLGNCPLWVISGHGRASALPPRADMLSVEINVR